MANPLGVQLEQCQALRDALAVCAEYGEYLTFENRAESNVTRDDYGNIIGYPTASTYSIPCYPIQFNPTPKQLEAAGLREVVDLTLYTATKSWIDAGVDWRDINYERMTVTYQGERYQISSMGRVGQIGDKWVWYTFGFHKQA